MDPKDDTLEFYTNPQQIHSYRAVNSTESLLAQRLLYAIFSSVLYWLEQGASSKAELNLGLKDALDMQEGPFSMMESIGVEKLEEQFDVLTQTVGERFRQANLRKYF
jgi:3-hydroxyacyl-CoA dehydrogenase